MACTVILHLLLCLANDIELNPGPTSGFHDILICHANIRSLKSEGKLLSIKCEFAGKYDIITLSETWLSAGDSSQEFKLPGY